MPRSQAHRTLFVVRGKLGDSLAAWPTIRAYRQHHPDEAIFVALRRNYAFLFQEEAGIRLLPFASTAELLLRVIGLRLTGGVQKLAVLWGFGQAVARVARWSGAPLRAYLDDRFGTLFDVIAPPTPNDYISDAAWRVATCLDPALPRPVALNIPSLANRRLKAQPKAIGLVPVADETRRVIDHTSLTKLVETARERFPGAPLWLLGNPKDEALQPILAAGLPEGVELKPFPELHQLVDALCHCHHLLTTDTGVYHLAASIGVPSTLFFGPTQPWKNALPEQPDVERVRLPSLANTHCEVKNCREPYCLRLAVDHWCKTKIATKLPDTLPTGCLLIAEEQNS